MYKLPLGTLLLALGTGAAFAGDRTAHPGHEHAAAPVTAPSGIDTPQTAGEIRRVDTEAQKITVKHGPIENLGMSPMTMAFRVNNPAFLTMIKPGDRVKMTVERVDGTLMIVALERMP